MKDRLVVYTEEGDEITLPTKFEVCPNCEGRGTHVNRNIDGNGLSSDDFAEDPDFAESYFSGHYDVRCDECHGDRVIAVPDEERMTPEMTAAWHDKCESDASDRAERRMWSRMAGDQ